MRVLIHKDVFKDFNLFKEACDCVLNNSRPSSLLFTTDFKTIRFDLDYGEHQEYVLDSYIELDESELQAQLDFGEGIENGVIPE